MNLHNEFFLQTTRSLCEGPRQRQGALGTRSKDRKTRRIIAEELKHELEGRARRHEERLRQEREWMQKLSDRIGISYVPYRSAHDAERALDEKESAKAISRVKDQMEASDKASKQCAPQCGSEENDKAKTDADSKAVIQLRLDVSVRNVDRLIDEVKEAYARDQSEMRQDKREETVFWREVEPVRVELTEKRERIFKDLEAQQLLLEQLAARLAEEFHELAEEMDEAQTLHKQLVEAAERHSTSERQAVEASQAVVLARVAQLTADTKALTASFEQLRQQCCEVESKHMKWMNEEQQITRDLDKFDIPREVGDLKRNIEWFRLTGSKCDEYTARITDNKLSLAKPDIGDRVQVLHGEHMRRFGEVVSGWSSSAAKKKIKFENPHVEPATAYVNATQVTLSGPKRIKCAAPF